MKEITREDWQKNPTPRMMWVWDSNEEYKKKLLVVHCLRVKMFVEVLLLKMRTVQQ